MKREKVLSGSTSLTTSFEFQVSGLKFQVVRFTVHCLLFTIYYSLSTVCFGIVECLFDARQVGNS